MSSPSSRNHVCIRAHPHESRGEEQQAHRQRAGYPPPYPPSPLPCPHPLPPCPTGPAKPVNFITVIHRAVKRGAPSPAPHQAGGAVEAPPNPQKVRGDRRNPLQGEYKSPPRTRGGMETPLRETTHPPGTHPGALTHPEKSPEAGQTSPRDRYPSSQGHPGAFCLPTFCFLLEFEPLFYRWPTPDPVREPACYANGVSFSSVS
jgi:hypothetical protein